MDRVGLDELLWHMVLIVKYLCQHQTVCPQDKEKRKFAVEEGDHVTLVNVFNAFLKVRKAALQVPVFLGCDFVLCNILPSIHP